MIAIVDYGVGNLFSLSSSLKALGLETEGTRDAEKLRAAGKNKGVTYQQLLAQKLTVQNLIGRFEIYGIKEN